MAKLLDQRDAIRLLKQNGWQHVKVIIHREGSGYWSEIPELPGCFASGRTLSELRESIAEAVGLYLWDEPVQVTSGEISAAGGELEICRGGEV